MIKELILTIIFMLFFLLGGLYSNDMYQEFHTFKSSYYSCDGINLFYTNKSFYRDEYYMHKQYEYCYKNDDNYISELFNLYKPIDLTKCEDKTIDCEDYSHMVNCLAKKYNISCKYYIQTTSHDMGHAGTQCLIDGEWEVVS